jgi:DNA-directed RNA polymerase specialized sigma24 family protein
MSFDITAHYTDVQKIVRARFGWTGLDMDDLTQAVFAAILRKNQTTPFDPKRSKYSSYIFLVARSTALNLLRQQQKCVPETVVPIELLECEDAQVASWHGITCDEIDEFLAAAPLFQLAFRMEREARTVGEIAKFFGWQVERMRSLLSDMHAILQMRYSVRSR